VIDRCPAKRGSPGCSEGLELQAGVGRALPVMVFQMGLRPSSESRGNQLGDAVAPEDDRSKTSCNDGEKKRGSYGVFHGAVLSTKVPAIRSQLVRRLGPQFASLCAEAPH
jgi:hypothetical protein